MRESTLYLEIFQPYAQYRNPFTFYYAQTFPLPPKSTIVGMLQNATDRYYDEEFWKLKISIHGGFESIFWNYLQLIKGYPEVVKIKDKLVVLNNGWPLYNRGLKATRTPVYQQELFNGHLYIFIRGKEDIIEEIYRNLDKPKKILSLGRGEDIIFIRNLSLVEESQKKSCKKSLWLIFPTYIRLKNGEKCFPIKNQKYPIYSIPVYVAFYNDNRLVKNKAEIDRRKTERKVNFENVIYTGFDYVIKVSEPIDYEEIIINDKKFRIVGGFGWI